MTVRIDDSTVYEPDALVRCGPRVPDDAIEIPDPTIVVEVVSRSSRSTDSGAKLADYFLLPSVRHYLVANADGYDHASSPKRSRRHVHAHHSGR